MFPVLLGPFLAIPLVSDFVVCWFSLFLLLCGMLRVNMCHRCSFEIGESMNALTGRNAGEMPRYCRPESYQRNHVGGPGPTKPMSKNRCAG